MEIDDRGRVWFVDSYSGEHIYTHYDGEWRGFTHGGTLKAFITALRRFIKTGEKLNRTHFRWPHWYSDGDAWGYGEEMVPVREATERLEIVQPVVTVRA